MGLKLKIRSSLWGASAVLLLSGCTSMTKKTEDIDLIGWETAPPPGSETTSSQKHYEEVDNSSSESTEEMETAELGMETTSTTESTHADASNVSAYETMIHNIRLYVQN